jgi:hypothetical protein
MLVFGDFKESETQQKFEFGLAFAAEAISLIFVLLAGLTVAKSERRRRIRMVKSVKDRKGAASKDPEAAGLTDAGGDAAAAAAPTAS